VLFADLEKGVTHHFIIKTKVECENIWKVILGFDSKNSKTLEAAGSDALWN